MNDQEMERLLRSMPLREPRRLPERLGAAAGGRLRPRGPWRRALTFQVPAWAAAAMVALAVGVTAGLATLGERGARTSPEGTAQSAPPTSDGPRSWPPGPGVMPVGPQVKGLLHDVEADLRAITTVPSIARDRFWRLPQYDELRADAMRQLRRVHLEMLEDKQ